MTAIPTCDRHGPMVQRANPSSEAAWCGTWHDWTRCATSHLTPSPALRAHLTNQPQTKEAGS